MKTRRTKEEGRRKNKTNKPIIRHSSFRIRHSSESGFIIPAILSLMVALSIITGAVVVLIDSNFSLVNRNIKSQQAFNIAEAGINYYLWHLSHNATDYKDGQSTPATPTSLGYGPYVHNYVDAAAKTEGTYTLYVNPTGGGSSIVKVRSIGQVTGTNITRTVEAQIGAPSFASYAILSDSALWFGKDEVADGPVHTNVGIRLDGASNADITSANATYTPSNAIGGDGSSHPGVWCDISVTSPVNCSTRPKTDWRYPVPLIDFNQINGTLCTVKKAAFASDAATASLATLANACSQTPVTRTNAYIPQRSSSANNSRGYFINLNSNNTYDLYTVNNVKDILANYSVALTPTLVASGIAVPANGVIFAEDNVWVRAGTTFAGRLTIAAARLATSVTANLTIVDNIKYSTKSGADAIGLMAEGSVSIAPFAPPATGDFTFEVDAALIAQSGNVVFPSNYTFSNTTCTRGWVSPNQTLLFYGSIAVRQTWTWSWLWGNNQCGDNVYDASSGSYMSGFKYNTTKYDYNLLYNPPPSWPITSSYNFLSWREVLVIP